MMDGGASDFGTALDSLARRLGIEREYWDTAGRHYRAPDETLVAILRAMGYPAETLAELDEVVARLDEIDATPLPATYRIAPGGAVDLPVRLGSGGLAWALTLEAGGVVEGSARTDSLPDVGEGRRLLHIDADFAIGYHRLVIETDGKRHVTTLIAAPERALGVEDLAGSGRRLWGVTAPLYGLVSQRNFGVGDFEDAARFAEAVAPLGADFLGFNPVHALFPTEPHRSSPYSPSSRLFLNVMHIAPDRMPEFAHCEAARRYVEANAVALAGLRDNAFVDYPEVARHKLALLDLLYETFRDRSGIDRDRQNAFADFRAETGPRLHRQALFDALSELLPPQTGRYGGFDQWPEAYRDPTSDAVKRFEVENYSRVGFYEFLQWVADEQLGEAARRARGAGMAFGLYLDLAVGVTPYGADVWSAPDEYAAGVSLGAPPDDLGPDGQRWGLAPFNVRALYEKSYRPFSDLLRSLLRHAKLARIDHVLGLNRAFWMPDGDLPGAYVRYPFDDLLAVLAVESHRARAVVIGEDLGNVPDGFRDRLSARNVLGCQLAYFERDWSGGFRPPEQYAKGVLTSIGTHDLPPLRGWWKGNEIAWRAKIDEKPQEVVAAQEAGRAGDRRALARMLGRDDAANTSDPAAGRDDADLVDDIARRLHARLAASPSDLVAVQIEDMLHREDQANLPGTIDEHPNWVRRLNQSVEGMADDERVTELAAIMRAGRGE